MEICDTGPTRGQKAKKDGLKQISHINCMYTNCDTLTNKLSQLTIAIELNNPVIIVLTEFTPKNNRYTLQKSEIEIKGFNLFTTNFNEKDSRGVAIYVKKSIISNQIEIENMANDTVWVEKNKKMLIGGIYRSPNNSALRNKLLFDTGLAKIMTFLNKVMTFFLFFI